MMVCPTAEISFDCVCDVVVFVMGGGGGLMLLREFCVCEME